MECYFKMHENKTKFSKVYKLLTCFENRFCRLTQIATHVNNIIWECEKEGMSSELKSFFWFLGIWRHITFKVYVSTNLVYQLAMVSPISLSLFHFELVFVQATSVDLVRRHVVR